MTLHDRTAVITGAGSGIGRAIAQALARRGCHLALVDISEPGLAETVQLVDGASIRISRHRLDVADRAAVATLPQAVVAEHGRVDLMFNNAGVALAGTFDQVSEADFDWLFEINFAAVVRLTRAYLPHLKSSDDARIVNMSSLFGLVRRPGRPPMRQASSPFEASQTRCVSNLREAMSELRGAPGRGRNEDCRECTPTRRYHQCRDGGEA
jgi:NAD(P)-dependent dehydrogenase (short-subunit alcohol dehydrogenase family)